MKHLAWIAIILAPTLALAQGEGVSLEDSPELQGFRKILPNEDAALRALRLFDLMQQDLYKWDAEIAEQLVKADEEELVAVKSQDAKRRIDLVRVAYEEFLRTYPKNPRAQNYYGELVYDYYGDHAKALQSWKLAVKLDDSLSMPYNNLAIHYTHTGDYEQGFRYMEKALELEPDNPDYLFNAAQYYLTYYPQIMRRYKWDENRLFKEAMALSRRAMEQNPDSYDMREDYAVNFFAAENLGVEPDWEEAANAWRQVREIARGESRIFYAWLNEARACVRGGLNDRARSCLQEALAIKPDSKAAKTLLEQVNSNKPAQQGEPNE